MSQKSEKHACAEHFDLNNDLQKVTVMFDLSPHRAKEDE